MSHNIGKIAAIVKKRKLLTDIEELQKELVDLQTLSDTEMYVKYIVGESTGINIATRPNDYKTYINNVSNGVNFFNNYMEVLTELSEMVNNGRVLIRDHYSLNLTTDEKALNLIEFNGLRAQAKAFMEGSYYNGINLFSGANRIISYGNTQTLTYNMFPLYDITTGSTTTTGAMPGFALTGSFGDVATYDTQLDKFREKVALAAATHEQLKTLKESLTAQYDSAIGGLNNYKGQRGDEIGASIDNLSRAVEIIEAIYDLHH